MITLLRQNIKYRYKQSICTTCVCISVFWCATCVCGAYVGVSVSQQLVEDVAELPAEDGVAGQRQPVDGGPEGVSALLMVGAQDAGWGRGGVKEIKHGRSHNDKLS